VVQDPPTVAGFDYPQWLRWHGTESYMDHGTVRVLQAADEATTVLATWRREAGRRTAAQLPEPAAGLLRGLLLGQQKVIDPNLWADFNTTQTSWLIVVSGSQITLLLVFVYWMSRRILAPWYAVVVAGGIVVIYSLFVGLGLSVARAALMGLLYLLAQGLGRPIAPLNLLVTVAIVLTALDPLSLGDVGFQLSFSTLVGILVVGPSLLRLKNLLSIMRSVFAIALAAQTTALPIVIAQFGTVSLAGFVAGALADLLLAPLMILGALYEFAAWLWLPAGQFVAWVCWLPLTLLAKAVHWAAHWQPFGLPFNSLEIPRFSGAEALTWYLVLAVLYISVSADRRAAVRRFLRPDPVPPAVVSPRTESPSASL